MKVQYLISVICICTTIVLCCLFICRCAETEASVVLRYSNTIKTLKNEPIEK